MTETKSTPSAEIPHYAGHRERLRDRFFSAGAAALQDYELIEMLLFAAIPRRDVKQLAKTLLAEFGSLWHLTQSTPERLKKFGLGDPATALILTMGAISLRAQQQSIKDLPVLNSWQRIVDYCRMAMAHDSREQFRLLFLNRKNHLLKDELHQYGTIDHTAVYPREIVQRALELGAGALVLVHNHPSGDTRPSPADLDMTRAIVAACQPLGINVHDHLIIGGKEVNSFKSLGLL